jgi:hypothetical protein
MKKLRSNFTTPEQSKRLLELGVPADSADMYYHTDIGFTRFYSEPEVIPSCELFSTGNSVYIYDIPCWSVGRLIEIHLKCCTTLNQNDAHIVISRFGIETGGLLQDIYDMVCECALLGRYDFSKLEE